MHQYVVYNQNTTDYPGQYIVRRHTIGPDENVRADELPLYVGASLAGARTAIDNVAPGLYCLPRLDGDDLVIMEVWL